MYDKLHEYLTVDMLFTDTQDQRTQRSFVSRYPANFRVMLLSTRTRFPP